MSEIFISHVEEDEGIALGIARELERAGYRTWYYERDADPGPSYLIQVHRAIERCRAIVIVISPAAVRSNQMTVEVVRGHEAGKPFLPVRSGITHAAFQQSQQEWRMALGASASLAVPPEGAAAVVPRLIRGLQGLGIDPGTGPADPDREDRAPREESAADPTQDARVEAARRQRDAEFAELQQRLDEQCDSHDYAEALGTAEAMLRLRPDDRKTLGVRAFISERLARSATRRRPLDLVHRLTASKWRTALFGAGALLAVLLGIGFFTRDDARQPPGPGGTIQEIAPTPPPSPAPAPAVTAVPTQPPRESPAPSPPAEAVKEAPKPPASPAPPRRQAPVVAQAPPTPAPAPRLAPYRGVDVIGRMPTVVQVYDPT